MLIETEPGTLPEEMPQGQTQGVEIPRQEDIEPEVPARAPDSEGAPD